MEREGVEGEGRVGLRTEGARAGAESVAQVEVEQALHLDAEEGAGMERHGAMNRTL
eukprot:SAG11_NODE_325_length_10712_cov_15.479883_9_plen_56_part_00